MFRSTLLVSIIFLIGVALPTLLSSASSHTSMETVTISAFVPGTVVGGGGGGGGLSPRPGDIITIIPPFSLEFPVPGCMVADLNCDTVVDIFDFSILIFWFEKVNPPSLPDLNDDAVVDIFDFSIMAYYWTQ